MVQAIVEAFHHPDGLAWREGFPEWVPIAKVVEQKIRGRTEERAVPPPLSQRLSDDVDFEMHGAEMQYVKIELAPGESAIVEVGEMLSKASAIKLNAIFGDGRRLHVDTGCVVAMA